MHAPARAQASGRGGIARLLLNAMEHTARSSVSAALLVRVRVRVRVRARARARASG